MVLCDDLEGWDEVGGSFKREGIYVYLWLIHVDIRQKPIQYYKAIILQIKINNFLLKKRALLSILERQEEARCWLLQSNDLST